MKAQACFTIRHMNIHDYDRVFSLWQQSEGMALDHGCDSQDAIKLYLERNPDMSFVAEEDNRIVAAILCGHDGRRGYIHHLAVDAGFRRQGIGSRLVEKCLRALQELGINKCHTHIFINNVQGLTFWNHIGWTLRKDIQTISSVIPIETEGDS